MKTKITKQESLQIIALLTLAQQAYRRMCDYEKAIYPILKTDDMKLDLPGIYMEDKDIDFDTLFEELGIKVK